MSVKVKDMTPDEIIEDLALHISDAIYNNDTRWMKKMFIEFAHEIIRLSNEEPDEIVNEVQRRMDAVVDAAVEDHCADENWDEAADMLSTAVESLLELREPKLNGA